MRKNFKENIYNKLYFGEDIPKPRETVLFLVSNGIKLENRWCLPDHEKPQFVAAIVVFIIVVVIIVVFIVVVIDVFIVVIIVVVIVVVDIVVVIGLVIAVR